MLFKGLIAAGVLLVVGVVLAPQLAWMSARKAFAPENRQKPWASTTAYRAGMIQAKFMCHGRALTIYRKAYEAWPKAVFRSDCHYKIGLCYEKTGQPEEAVAWYASFIEAYPKHRWHDVARKRKVDLEAGVL